MSTYFSTDEDSDETAPTQDSSTLDEPCIDASTVEKLCKLTSKTPFAEPPPDLIHRTLAKCTETPAKPQENHSLLRDAEVFIPKQNTSVDNSYC